MSDPTRYLIHTSVAHLLSIVPVQIFLINLFTSFFPQQSNHMVFNCDLRESIMVLFILSQVIMVELKILVSLCHFY